MMGIGLMGSGMGMARNNFLMGLYILDNLLMIRNMDRERDFMLIRVCLMGSGRMISIMGRAV